MSRPKVQPDEHQKERYFLVYGLSELAELVALPESTVKNWTFGRPLAIAPSVSTGGGKGSRSLYSLNDVYRFAVARELVKAGFTPRKIQPVIDQLTDAQVSHFGYEYRALSIIRRMESPDLLSVEFLGVPDLELARIDSGDRLSVVLMGKAGERGTKGLPDRRYFERLYQLGITGAFILDLGLIVGEIDYRDAEIGKRQEARAKRAKSLRSMPRKSGRRR